MNKIVCGFILPYHEDGLSIFKRTINDIEDLIDVIDVKMAFNPSISLYKSKSKYAFVFALATNDYGLGDDYISTMQEIIYLNFRLRPIQIGYRRGLLNQSLYNDSMLLDKYS